MPNIKKAQREKYIDITNKIHRTCIENPADLSFLITQLMAEYMYQAGPGWTHASDILKAVDAAREEFMEEVYRPYEKWKRKENGGVF